MEECKTAMCLKSTRKIWWIELMTIINTTSHLPSNFVLTAQVSRPVYLARQNIGSVIKINLTVFLTLAYFICLFEKENAHACGVGGGYRGRGKKRILLSRLYAQCRPRDSRL